MGQIELLFIDIHRVLEQIKDPQTFVKAHELIKEKALQMNELAQQASFSVTYTKKIKNEFYDNFLKAMQIKSRDATGIVPSINSCRLVEKLPMGFRREIFIGDHIANQRVWELKNENSFMILFKTNGINFIATNELEKGKNETIFTARYIVDRHPNPKYSTPESFLEVVMNPTYDNLGNLSLTPTLNTKHKEIYEKI